MSSRSERTIVQALGVPSNDTTKVSFTATAASGILDAESLYRIVATEDCYVKLDTAGSANVDNADMLLIGGIPEVFQTTANETSLGVLRKDADGDLHATKMKSPKA